MSRVLLYREMPPPRPHWLADDAVRCQPVSGIEFPGNREINREFCKFGAFLAIPAPNRRANSMDCSKIPYCTGTGNFLRITGNFSEGTGNSGDRIKASTWKQTSQRAQGDQKGDQRLRKSDRRRAARCLRAHSGRRTRAKPGGYRTAWPLQGERKSFGAMTNSQEHPVLCGVHP